MASSVTLQPEHMQKPFVRRNQSFPGTACPLTSSYAPSHMHTHLCTYAHTGACTLTHTHKHVRAHARAHTRTRTHKHMRTTPGSSGWRHCCGLPLTAVWDGVAAPRELFLSLEKSDEFFKTVQGWSQRPVSLPNTMFQNYTKIQPGTNFLQEMWAFRIPVLPFIGANLIKKSIFHATKDQMRPNK